MWIKLALLAGFVTMIRCFISGDSATMSTAALLYLALLGIEQRIDRMESRLMEAKDR